MSIDRRSGRASAEQVSSSLLTCTATTNTGVRLERQKRQRINKNCGRPREYILGYILEDHSIDDHDRGFVIIGELGRVFFGFSWPLYGNYSEGGRLSIVHVTLSENH